jgi:hypothetical protein
LTEQEFQDHAKKLWELLKGYVIENKLEHSTTAVFVLSDFPVVEGKPVSFVTMTGVPPRETVMVLAQAASAQLKELNRGG